MNRYKILNFLLSLLLVLITVNCKHQVTSEKGTTNEKDSVYSLSSGKAKLRIIKLGKNKLSYSFSFDGNTYKALDSHPIFLKINGKKYNFYYKDVLKKGGLIICKGRVNSSNGSTFTIKDKFSSGIKGGFILDRTIKVNNTSKSDNFFNSYFGISDNNSMKDYNFLLPGSWYKNNSNLKSGSIGSNYNDKYLYAREDRLPLPFVMYRHKKSGATASVLHLNATPETFLGDAGTKRVIDKRMQFGSLGVRNLQNITSLVFVYPGSEGKATYFGDSWAYRSHPVKKGFEQNYKLLIYFSKSNSYPSALERSWKKAYKKYQPKINYVDISKVYRDEIQLLDTYWKNVNGSPGWPFSVYLPDGNPRAYNYQMGFIGMQLPNAYHMIYNGLQTNNNAILNKGIETINFWAKYSPMPSGLPRTWGDAHENQDHTWRSYPTYMRVAGDGMEGALHAWSVMKKNNISKPKWLAFCKNFGDWLVRNQNVDGSYYLSYDWSTGDPTHGSKYTTTNVIRYLVELYYATQKESYLNAAIKAGNFSYNLLHKNYSYVGSVIDNPNVKDRESGQQAMNAFLALYDVTSKKKWLNAAVQAARYTETFIYCYNIPMINNDPRSDFPKNKKTTGQTLIATGQSGVDNGISWSSFQFFRLYLFTGDEHFLNVAKLSMYNSLQTMDLKGNLNYPYRALQTEAFSLVASNRGHSVGQWLPWITAAVLDPIHRFNNAFGKMGLKEIEMMPKSQLEKMNDEYSKTRGIYSKR